MADLFAKKGVEVHVFTAFIFPSEQCEEIILNLVKAALLFRYFLLFCFLSRVYHSYTLQSVHHPVAMQWPSVLLYGLDPERLQSHLWRGTALCNLRWFVVTASELDQPSLTPLFVAFLGRLHLGVAY